MTTRERLLAVYAGEQPDCVPFMLDLSHWWLHRQRLPWDLSRPLCEPEAELLAYHRTHGIGFYLPTLPAFFTTTHSDGVAAGVARQEDPTRALTWHYRTPLGSISRTRLWEQSTYSWRIADWGVKTEQDLRVLACALGGRGFTSDWAHYRAWQAAVGDQGLVYLSLGYSAIGYLMNLWLGPAETLYLAHDNPALLQEVVDGINEANLRLVELACSSPAEVILLGDNFSTDLQPPHFFARWSQPYYAAAIGRLHAAGKCVAVHLDGRLRGGLRMLAEVGADAADAVTPGDLTAAECRAEAGLVLSGGVPPALWLAETPEQDFVAAVRGWLDLRHDSPRLIANAGDQVPPGAPEGRLLLMRELVHTYGRY